MVWDYEDSSLQEYLLGNADLVVAAASDETISRIQAQIRSLRRPSQPRFHAHGHKVSFAAIGSEMFNPGLVDSASSQRILAIITFLAALDSIYWDQFGCLSARVHFVENTGHANMNSLEYCRILGQQLSLLAHLLPRGSWPRQSIHNSFDRYNQFETTGRVKVFSHYDDDFLLVHDGREFNPAKFVSQVNECQGTVIVVRPVNDLDEMFQQLQQWIECLNAKDRKLHTDRGVPAGKGDLDYRQFVKLALIGRIGAEGLLLTVDSILEKR